MIDPVVVFQFIILLCGVPKMLYGATGPGRTLLGTTSLKQKVMFLQSRLCFAKLYLVTKTLPNSIYKKAQQNSNISVCLRYRGLMEDPY